MPKDMVEQTLTELRRWAVASGIDIDLGEARALLLAARDRASAARVSHLRQELGTPLPASDSRMAIGAGNGPTTARVIARFMAETGLPADGGRPWLADQMRALIAELAGTTTPVVPGPRGTRATEVGLTDAAVDAVDVVDEATVLRWLYDGGEIDRLATDAFNGTGKDGASVTLSRFDEIALPPTLPPVHLAGTDELATIARAAPELELIRRLAQWVGRRRLTDTDVLRRADARAAVVDLGLVGCERHRDERWPRSARDIPDLDRRWNMALATEMLLVSGHHAGPGPGIDRLSSGDGAAVVELWYAAFSCWLDMQAQVRDATLGLLVDGQVPGLLVLLYGAEQPMAISSLADEIVPGDGLLGDVEEEWTGEMRAMLAAAFTELARLGAVVVSEGEVALTGLGTWGLRRRLLEEGYEAPVVGGLAAASARELLDGIGGHSAAEAQEEIAAWLGRRSATQAATELVAAAHAAEPIQRRLAFALLDRVGREAAPIIADAMRDPELRPYATVWLADHDENTEIEPTTEDTSWLLIDMGAALIDSGDPAYLAEQLGLEIPASDLARRIEDLWRVEHPRAADVLTAIGDHHPDRAVAKAARKASFRARSRALA